MFSDADSRNRSGSLFHRSGPANPKAAAPIALFGTGRCNSRSIGWRRRLSRHFGSISLDRYAGAVPFMHLYTMTISLYVIRHSTGNQCSCFNTGVMCSRNGVRVTKPGSLVLDGLQPFHLGIREIGKQGVAVVQSRCYESLYYAPCCICCDITADRRHPVEMEVASFAHCRHLFVHG